MPESGWSIASTVAAGASALFAALQISISRRDANNRAALEALRNVDTELRAAWDYDIETSQAEVIAYFSGKTTTLPHCAKSYLSLLNAIDLLALAVQQKLVSRKIVEEHIPTLLNKDVVSLTFLTEFRKSCEDEGVYIHLQELLIKLEEIRRRLAKTTKHISE